MAEQQRQESLNGSFAPTGGSTNANPLLTTTPNDAIEAEVEKVKAMSPEERRLHILENFGSYNNAVRERIAMLP